MIIFPSRSIVHLDKKIIGFRQKNNWLFTMAKPFLIQTTFAIGLPIYILSSNYYVAWSKCATSFIYPYAKVLLYKVDNSGKWG